MGPAPNSRNFLFEFEGDKQAALQVRNQLIVARSATGPLINSRTFGVRLVVTLRWRGT